MATKKLSPKKTAKKKVHFDRMALQQKQTSKIRELRKSLNTTLTDLNKVSEENESLKSRITALEAEIKQAEEARSLISAENEKLYQETVSLKVTVENYTATIDRLTASEEKLTNDNRELQEKVDAAKKFVEALEQHTSITPNGPEAPADVGSQS